MKLACHTITFGDEQNQRFPEIFNALSAIGYSGVEIGFRHIGPLGSQQLKEWLDAADLQLVATHLGGNLEDTSQAAGEQKIIDEVMDFLWPLGTRMIMYSGLRFVDDAQFKRDLAMLDHGAQRCADRGFRLLYHNHDWEFADDQRVMSALVQDTDAALGFCPDVGWIDKSGTDVLSFLPQIRDRIGAVHFKDFASRDRQEKRLDTVELGNGVVPIADVIQWLGDKDLSSLWGIAEQDTSELSAEEAVRINYNYLQSVQ